MAQTGASATYDLDACTCPTVIDSVNLSPTQRSLIIFSLLFIRYEHQAHVFLVDPRHPPPPSPRSRLSPVRLRPLRLSLPAAKRATRLGYVVWRSAPCASRQRLGSCTTPPAAGRRRWRSGEGPPCSTTTRRRGEDRALWITLSVTLWGHTVNHSTHNRTGICGVRRRI